VKLGTGVMPGPVGTTYLSTENAAPQIKNIHKTAAKAKLNVFIKRYTFPDQRRVFRTMTPV